MHNRDFIIIGQQAWDTTIGSNCKNIALELSRHNRVLYINSPLDRVTLYRDRANPKVKKRLEAIRNKRNELVHVQENLWNLYPDCLVESINWIGNSSFFDFFNKRNNSKFAESIREAIEQLGFKDYILFNDNEMFKGFYLKELLNPCLSIYYSRDYMLAVDYWKRHGAKLEPLLIAKSDICLANSLYLAEYCKSYNENSFYIGQGCELELFKINENAIAPKELENISKPVIGYVGALEHIRLDIELIKHIALSRPDWTVVLVGREDEAFVSSDLHQIKNIIFTGIKPVAELPLYIQFFDVCINPQLVNEVTIGNYPRKVDEYLAMGKPTVATATKAMEIFSSHVYLANGKEEYVQLIEKAIVEDSPRLQTERTQFASTHTWENCIKEIYKTIELITDKK
ncbi:glycosyltransferase [Pedobacter sp.]|jgi:teichuronic acid biosynthesis glycosyltransferase TuaH|uniref:glycosyltransferase n=1 Tax=Pedobacter sp. TaxID=1411316 RepID=UPI002B9F8B40|nr:glycosyltransferase [Pedobacter sp.]HWW37658.1 glycosyltransferase [Pedobacter sp.]